VALLVGLLVGGGVGAGAVWLVKRNKAASGGPGPDAPLATAADELAMVPADAMGFAHVRLAELWKSGMMAEFRKVVEKAGPAALAALDEGFVPAPSSVDRLTVVVLKNPAGGPEPVVLGLVALSAPYDAAQVRRTHLPAAIKQQSGGKEFWFDPQADIAAHFPSDRLIVVGMAPAVAALLAKQPATDGPLAPALKLAGSGGGHLVAGVNVGALPIPPQAFDQVPPEVRPLLRARAVSLGLTIGEPTRFELRASYADDAAATDAEKAVKAAAEMGRKAIAEARQPVEAMLHGRPGQPRPRPIKDLPEAIGGLFAVGAMNTVDEFLADPPVKREGAELRASLSVPSVGGAYLSMTAMSIGLLLPAVQKVREAASRVQGSNNLKQIGIAMHNYHDVNAYFPPAGHPGFKNLPNPNAKPLLSWRVHLLPYLEENQLYQQFNLDEPWDSPNNKKLIERMPKIYTSPRAVAPPGQTYYKVFVAADPKAPGPTPIFVPGRRINMLGITDGTSNTILAAEGGDPVIWTKPDDFVYDPKKPLPKLALPDSDTISALFADGTVRTIRLKVASEKTLRLLILCNDGEPTPTDF
jgi:hypothetical protein